MAPGGADRTERDRTAVDPTERARKAFFAVDVASMFWRKCEAKIRGRETEIRDSG